MHRILAIATLMATTQASAFWGWGDSDGATRGHQNTTGDLSGDYNGDAEASFSMNFKGRGKTRGNLEGDADSKGRWAGYSYQAPYYYGYTPYYALPPAPSGD